MAAAHGAEYDTVACVGEFARRHDLPLRDAFNFLHRHGAIAFLKEHYEIEHTLSFDDAVDDMMIICRQNGGEL